MRVKIEDVKVGKRVREDYGDIEGLAQSIQKYGLLHPVIVSDAMELIAGERRFKAHVYLGLGEIEVKKIGELSEMERAEIELEENIKRKQFTWQEEVRGKMLLDSIKKSIYGVAVQGHESDGWGVKDTALALGESVGEVSQDILLAKGIEMYPELKKEKNKTSAYKKLRRLKEQAIRAEIQKKLADVSPVESAHLGDCREVMAKLEQEFDLIVTDPPYGIDLPSSGKEYKQYGRDDIFEDREYETDEMLEGAFGEMYRLLKDGRHAYVFFGIARMNAFHKLLTKAGFDVDPIPIIWSKGASSAAANSDGWSRSYEAIFHCRKGKRELNRNPLDVAVFKPVPSRLRIHPVEKPVGVMKLLIEVSTLPGEVVLDPFAGSGVVGEAALKLKRDVVLIEKDKNSYNGVCERIRKIQGRMKE
tara:strand:- start:9630 stop:10880 length:1251 start_codon:yes stop_codon:yes gene_type:complete